jgi:chromate transporter
LLIGILPYWERLRRNRRARKVLLGVNAGVVGLLAAAFFSPVLTSGVHGPVDLILAVFAFWMLQFRNLPSWSVVLICAVAGLVIY